MGSWDIVAGIPFLQIHQGQIRQLESGFTVTVQGQSPKQNDESSVESCAANVIRRNLPNTEVADLEVSVGIQPQRYEWIVP